MSGIVPARYLPPDLYRVVWLEGFGFPRVTRREHAQRTFAEARAAGEQVEIIERWASHHTLLGVFHTATLWTPIDPLTLPRPVEEDVTP